MYSISPLLYQETQFLVTAQSILASCRNFSIVPEVMQDVLLLYAVKNYASCASAFGISNQANVVVWLFQTLFWKHLVLRNLKNFKSYNNWVFCYPTIKFLCMLLLKKILAKSSRGTKVREKTNCSCLIRSQL